MPEPLQLSRTSASHYQSSLGEVEVWWSNRTAGWRITVMGKNLPLTYRSITTARNQAMYEWWIFNGDDISVWGHVKAWFREHIEAYGKHV